MFPEVCYTARPEILFQPRHPTPLRMSGFMMNTKLVACSHDTSFFEIQGLHPYTMRLSARKHPWQSSHVHAHTLPNLAKVPGQEPSY
jgi:hypothetical protein